MLAMFTLIPVPLVILGSWIFWNRVCPRYYQLRLWFDITNIGYSASMQVVFSLGGLIAWYVGGRDVIGNEMTLGELIAFLANLAMFYAPLNELSRFTTRMTSFLSGSKRVLELLDTPSTLLDVRL